MQDCTCLSNLPDSLSHAREGMSCSSKTTACHFSFSQASQKGHELPQHYCLYLFFSSQELVVHSPGFVLATVSYALSGISYDNNAACASSSAARSWDGAAQGLFLLLRGIPERA